MSVGPCDRSTIEKLIVEKIVQPHTLIWTPPAETWIMAKEMVEFQDKFSLTPPPVPVPPPKTSNAPNSLRDIKQQENLDSSLRYKYAIEPQYSNIRSFSDGVAFVNVHTSDKGVPVIDKSGKQLFILFPTSSKNKIEEVYPFSEGYALILEFQHTGVIFSPHDKAYVIDKTGAVVLKFDKNLYEAFRLRNSDSNKMFTKGELYIPQHGSNLHLGGYTINIKGRKVSENLDSDYCDDIARGARRKFGLRIKNGFVDRSGNFLFERSWFGGVEFFSGDVLVRYEDERLKGIDKQGHELFQVVCDKPEYYILERRKSNKEQLVICFQDGLCPIYKNGLWGFINKQGTVVIEPQFFDVGNFSQGVCPVQKQKDELWGFITKDGRHCIPPTFQHAYSFSEGVAGVKVNDKWGFIVME